MHIGRPLLAQRVTDVQTLLTFLQADARRQNLSVELRASGAAALHAAVLLPAIGRLVLAQMPLSYTEPLGQPLTRDGYSTLLPGVLRQHDLPDLQRVLGARLRIAAW